MAYQTCLLQDLFRSCHETSSIQQRAWQFLFVLGKKKKVSFICISRNDWFDFSLNPSVKLHFRPHINIILLSHNAFVSGVIPFTAAVLPFSYPNGNKSRITPIKKLLTERNTERKNTEINTSSGLFNIFVCPNCNRDIYFKKYCLISKSKHWYILNPKKQFLHSSNDT